LIRGGFFARISRPLSFEFCRGHLKLGRAIREATLIETFSDEKSLYAAHRRGSGGPER
jgi:hypothetical protein